MDFNLSKHQKCTFSFYAEIKIMRKPCRCPALFLVSLHCCFYLRLCLWGFSSRPQFDPQNSTDFLAVGGPPAFPWLSCLPDPHQRACLLLRQERDMTVWPTYMLTHRFIARLNEDAASSLYRVTLQRFRSAPAPLQQQRGQQEISSVYLLQLWGINKHLGGYLILNHFLFCQC